MSLHVDVCGFASHKGGQFVMDYLDHHLVRSHGGKHVHSECLLLHIVAELLGNLIADIGVEQCPPYILERFRNVYFGNLSLSFQNLERTFESVY